MKVFDDRRVVEEGLWIGGREVGESAMVGR